MREAQESDRLRCGIFHVGGMKNNIIFVVGGGDIYTKSVQTSHRGYNTEHVPGPLYNKHAFPTSGTGLGMPQTFTASPTRL